MAVLEGTDMDPAIEAHTLVIVTNQGQKPLTLMHAGKRFTMEPGVPRSIPYTAMCLWFGNPKLRDLSTTKMDLRYRTNERERLSQKYAIAPGEKWYSDPAVDPTRPRSSSFYPDMDPTAPYVDTIIADRVLYRHPNLPNVICTTYDQQRIITVIEDPDGVLSYPSPDTSSRSEVEDLVNQVDMLRRQMLALTAQLGATNPDAALQAAQLIPPRITTSPTTETTLPTYPVPDARATGEQSPGLQLGPDPTQQVMDAMQQLTRVNEALSPEPPASPFPSPAPTVADMSASGMTDAIAADPKPVKKAGVHKPRPS